jgi:hypothetical protein
MDVNIRATIDDLYKVEGKAELVNGEIVKMPPAGDDPNVAGGEIFVSLRDYARRIGRGKAYTDGVGFHVSLLHRESFEPNAAYHIGPRTGMRFLEGARLSLLWKSAVKTTTARPQNALCERSATTILPAGLWSYGT